MISSFSAFTTARLGMIAAQKALDTTGHNITNINTPGYTRQILDQYSLQAGGGGFLRGGPSANVGSGVLVNSIKQLRDPYLDIRFRNELSGVGAMDSKLGSMEQISAIFDEVSKLGVKISFEDFASKLAGLSSTSGQQSSDTLVRTSAETLVKLFNAYSSNLETTEKNLQDKFKQDVTTVNNILQKIQGLNENIRINEIYGDNALELRDQRNLLIDELSQYVKVDVTYTEESIGAGKTIEKLNIKLATGNKDELINGIYAATLTLPENVAGAPNTQLDMLLGKLTSSNGDVLEVGGVASTDKILSSGSTYGGLESSRDMLLKGGEFDNPPTSTRGVPYYRNVLDSLANKFATLFNEANTVEDPANPGTILKGGALFESSDGAGTTITAKNIKISQGWASGAVNIISNRSLDPADTSPDNILHMIAMMSEKNDYTPDDTLGNDNTTPFFRGSFVDMYINISATVGNDMSTASTMLDTYATSADSLNSSRDGVAGVDLNEEGTNLMQYQKAFAAACRLMTTLDEAMDKVINGMGVVGR